MVRALLLILGSTLAAMVPLLLGEPQYPELRIIPCVGVGLVAAVALRLMLYGDTRDVLLLVVSGLTFVLYQNPLLSETFRYQATHRFSYEQLVLASWYSLAALAMMVVGYTCAKGLQVRPLLTHVGRHSVAPPVLAKTSLVLMGLAVGASMFRSEIRDLGAVLGRTIFLVDQLPLLAIAVGGLALLDGYRNKLFAFVLFGLYVPFEVLLIVARTLFYHLVVLFTPLIVMYALRRGRLPLIQMALGALLLVPAFKARMEARIEMGYGDKLPVPELLAIGFARIVDAWSPADSRVIARRNEFAEARLNSLSLLAHVVREHEVAGKPYKLGSTFWWLPITPVPRIIFPAKPRNDHGDSFPIEYGIKTASERYAVVLPLVVESYINGGIIAILLLNFGIGVAYYLCSAFFEHGRGTLNLVALSSVLSLSVYVENNITMVFGAAMQAGLLWFLVDRLAMKRFRRVNVAV